MRLRRAVGEKFANSGVKQTMRVIAPSSRRQRSSRSPDPPQTRVPRAPAQWTAERRGAIGLGESLHFACGGLAGTAVAVDDELVTLSLRAGRRRRPASLRRRAGRAHSPFPPAHYLTIAERVCLANDAWGILTLMLCGRQVPPFRAPGVEMAAEPGRRPTPRLEGAALAVVRHCGVQLQIVAAAGSGKTELSWQRVADLLADA